MNPLFKPKDILAVGGFFLFLGLMMMGYKSENIPQDLHDWIMSGFLIVGLGLIVFSIIVHLRNRRNNKEIKN